MNSYFFSSCTFCISILFVVASFCIHAQNQGSIHIEGNSGVTDPQIRVVETETGFSRISWENTNNPGKFWTAAGLTNDIGSSRLNFYYEDGSSGNDILTIHGDHKAIGINTTAPNYAFDLKSNLASPGTGTGPWGGLNINGGTDNDWTLFAFSNLFDFYYKNVLKGRISGVDGVYSPISDVRLKDNIEVIAAPQLENIRKLRPVAYYMKDDKIRSSKTTGFIAQAVQEVFPTLVVSGAENDDYLSLNYTAMIPYLVKAIQEIAEQNEELVSEMSRLHKSLNTVNKSRMKRGRK